MLLYDVIRSLVAPALLFTLVSTAFPALADCVACKPRLSAVAALACGTIST